MCGIAGWLGSMADSRQYAEWMAKALQHRGPDAHGIQHWPMATLVHTRLKIIDLSDGGAQPMANEDQTIWVTFNGEIYNHRELRRELEVRGHRFKGHSDTEVLPHLYEEKGLNFVECLRGMFALAVYDTVSQTLVLARDHFGIKPLFFTPSYRRLAFASEIRPLVELPGVDTQIERQAVFDFSALAYIPAPETFYKGIRALQPGELLVAQLDNSEEVTYTLRSYHRWSITPDYSLTLSEAVDRTESLLTRAVQSQMESEVPLATLLSGGIDSSLVSVAAAQETMVDSLRSFNVRFQDEAFDETWAAVSVAKHIGSHHETLDMGDGQGTWDHVTNLLLHTGQPFADTSLFAMNGVCRLLRKHVTVALSGDGGDEGFGGYNLYWQLAKIARWQALPSWVWGGTSHAMKPLTYFGKPFGRLSELLGDLATADNTAILQYLFCWVRENEHRLLCRDSDLLPIRRLFEPRWETHFPASASRLERLSAHATEVNVRLTLANDFLFKVDTASMKESLEIRVPMLDENLFALGLSLPHSLKVNGKICKRILRELANRRLPEKVANKPKQGFGVPVDSWVDEDFKARLKDYLLGPISCLPEFFRPEVYRPIVTAFCDGHSHQSISRQGLYQRVIMLLSLQLAMCK